MVPAAHAGGLLWRTTKFIRFFGPLMRSIPPRWSIAVSDPNMKDFFRFMIVSKPWSPEHMNMCSSRLVATQMSGHTDFYE
jgi:hypothetical protein